MNTNVEIEIKMEVCGVKHVITKGVDIRDLIEARDWTEIEAEYAMKSFCEFDAVKEKYIADECDKCEHMTESDGLINKISLADALAEEHLITLGQLLDEPQLRKLVDFFENAHVDKITEVLS